MYLGYTWPQIYLLLDGAAYNAPVFEETDKDGNPKKDIPPKPDMQTQPIERLRWDLKYGPVPGFMRMPDDDIEALCKRFEGDIAAGRKVWDSKVKQWVNPI